VSRRLRADSTSTMSKLCTPALQNTTPPLSTKAWLAAMRCTAKASSCAAVKLVLPPLLRGKLAISFK